MTLERKGSPNPAQNGGNGMFMPLKAKLSNSPEVNVAVSSREKLQELIRVGREHGAGQDKGNLLNLGGLNIQLTREQTESANFILFGKYSEEEKSIDQQRKAVEHQQNAVDKKKFDDLVSLFADRKQSD